MRPDRSWAAPQIQTVTAAGLMGTKTPATFRPNDPLTAQALANLVFGLSQVLFPPPPILPIEPVPPVEPVTTDPTATAPTTTDPTTTDPTTTDPTTTDPTTTTTTDPTQTTPVPGTTTTEPTPAPPPATPPKVANPGATVSMTALDARLVSALGLTQAAAEFAQGARAAGLKVPARFGNEVVARLLGLRTNHPAIEDSLELLPNDPATRAEAAYSAAAVLHFGGWEVAGVQSLADSFTLPQLSAWQTRILDTAVARIGMPYVWGGTSDGSEVDFGVPARGGYDCSGFVWRVYKLKRYAGEGNLASVLRGRTTFVMSGEVPGSQRIGFADLQPADVLFFGAHGPSSQPSEVDHTAIYLGNGWFIQSSGEGVALATLTGYYRHEFAWARRPLREAGLSG
ncbi:MAG TPA: NlpC/P60 family protein [Gaiellaceae bacterium]|nr:NlpC/P60 family protein [Gaiellaceae bacterium]